MGEKSKQEGVYVYVWLIHFAIQQKLIQHCKATIRWGEVAQSCPTLCNSVDCSPPGSSVHGILQARILEWVAISFSRGSSWPRDRTQVSHIGGRRFNLWATREALVKKKIEKFPPPPTLQFLLCVPVAFYLWSLCPCGGIAGKGTPSRARNWALV